VDILVQCPRRQAHDSCPRQRWFTATAAICSHVSSTFVVAIDFEAWDLRKGPITIDGDSDRSFLSELDILPDLIAARNISTFEFDLEAIGENKFADVAFSVLSVEDRLSSVAATADLGIA
jgi:hypothetical protein